MRIFKAILVTFFMLCPVLPTLGQSVPLVPSGNRMNLGKGSSLHIVCCRDSIGAQSALPLVSLSSYGHSALTLIVEADSSSASVKMVTPSRVDSYRLGCRVNPCVVDATLKVLPSGDISFNIWGNGITFRKVDADANATFDIMIPEGFQTDIAVDNVKPEMFDRNSLKWVFAILLFDLLLCIFLAAKRRFSAKDEGVKRNLPVIVPVEHNKVSSIFVFGDFKLLDKDGEDIAKSLSPMLQELFLLLICHYPEGGISSASLKEYLWFDKDTSSARNNRAVYMNRLKKILEGVGECSITRNGDFWLFDKGDIEIDYYSLFDLLSSKADTESVKKVVDILSSGPLLAHFDNSAWSDRIKARTTDAAVAYMENFLTSFSVKDNPELVISAADALFSLDSINETALVAKCKAYRQMGNHAMVKKLFVSFQREYSSLYGEDFGKTFSELILD